MLNEELFTCKIDFSNLYYDNIHAPSSSYIIIYNEGDAYIAIAFYHIKVLTKLKFYYIKKDGLRFNGLYW